ncbi:DUF5343 domain-containing protein [Amycolatopsis thermophila]|uniref:DUF5343 domain-containing protein n=1 Tax=Amycolatopsis thermophila TaxID=206084 RepID=A0ABU0EUR9_9PSEU|nr:DUF5343 domain-containing protein [Amycolatopsis thermophila]MDQ0379050.1 hypothetical protein [Amycolatopsis thermophila]
MITDHSLATCDLGEETVAETLPYMNSTGLVSKILDKIKEAKTPDRFSQDFLGTVLGFSSGSAKPFIPLAKRLTLIRSDGTPSELYRKFRGSEDESKAAIAQAIRIGYAPLYKRNEFAHELDKKKLDGLIREITGIEDGNSVLRAITGTFEALKQYADFDAVTADKVSTHSVEDAEDSSRVSENLGKSESTPTPLRFGYTININLPDTNDIAVFNAIFKSMKEHLL